jgi:hypothetical protein
MRSRRFRVVIRTPERRAGEHDRRRRGDDAPRAADLADLSAASDSGNSDEQELVELVREVREARDRLLRLIATMTADRARWPERQQRWGRLREAVRHFHEPQSIDEKKH